MRIVIITGASSGMGREFALQLDKKLHSIDEYWLVGRNEEELAKTKKKMHTKTRNFIADFNSRKALFPLVQEINNIQPEVKMLVNCAGFGMVGDFDRISYNDNLSMIDVNCRALTSLTHDCIPFMAVNSRIINIASAGAFNPQPGFAVYCATKSYVLSFSRALRGELKDLGIYVTAVCPGPVNTPFFNKAERYGTVYTFKKLFMADQKSVVSKAIDDSNRCKEISVYGRTMRAYRVLAKVVPHRFIIELLNLMHKLKK